MQVINWPWTVEAIKRKQRETAMGMRGGVYEQHVQYIVASVFLLVCFCLSARYVAFIKKNHKIN